MKTRIEEYDNINMGLLSQDGKSNQMKWKKIVQKYQEELIIDDRKLDKIK